MPKAQGHRCWLMALSMLAGCAPTKLAPSPPPDIGFLDYQRALIRQAYIVDGIEQACYYMDERDGDFKLSARVDECQIFSDDLKKRWMAQRGAFVRRYYQQ